MSRPQKDKKKRENRAVQQHLMVVVLCTILAYLSALQNEFIINWDDHLYITDNESIKSLSLNSIIDLFTTYHYENYHPLTNLTNALEFYFFGLNPFPYHVVNVLLHIANVSLVFFLVLKLFNERLFPATVAAALFALHPMHVESVAWLSERKDLLYTFFFLLALWSYIKFIDKNEWKGLILALVFFFFSCLSKSAAVSLPLVLLLITWYRGKTFSFKNLIPTIPFFILSLVFGWIALDSQSSTGATAMVAESFTLLDRFFLGCYAFSFYILKVFWPLDLSALYLYPSKAGGALPFIYYIAPLLPALLVYIAYRSKFVKKELIFGFLFFLITIALMLQFIPVGRAIVAERYSYLSYFGLFFIIGVVADSKKVFPKVPIERRKLLAYGFIILVGFLTFQRTKVWENGETLFTDVINKQPSAIAYYNRGYVRQMNKQTEIALQDFNKSIEFDSAYALAYNNRGGAKYFLKDYQGAIEDYTYAIKYDTGNVDGYYNRGFVKQTIKDYDGALQDYQRSLKKSPETATTVYLSIGNLKQELKDYKGAIEAYSKSIESDPKNSSAYFNMGNAYYMIQQDSSALSYYRKTIELNRSYADAYYNAGMASLNLNKEDQACAFFKEALNMGKGQAQKYVSQYCK